MKHSFLSAEEEKMKEKGEVVSEERSREELEALTHRRRRPLR
jgi:hypothetical protein